MPKILVTGSDGQLGNKLRSVCQGSANEYIFSNREMLDITSFDDVREFCCGHQINYIVNCAAYNDVEKAEIDVECCDMVNHLAVENLAKVSKEIGAALIHLSTDYVFGNSGFAPLVEGTSVDPLNVYGLSKCRGERAIMESSCQYIIIRTSWMYSEIGHNFVNTILSLANKSPKLRVVMDQVGSPTYAGDIASVIYGIIEEGKIAGNNGIYHYSNEGACSWFDFAKEIVRIAGITECDVLPCRSDEFPSPVNRPAYSVLDKTKIKEVFGIDVPYWTDSLRQCIQNLKNQ